MARRRRSSGGVKVVRVAAARAPAPVIRVSAPAGIRGFARRHHRYGKRIASAASSEKHTLVALAAAGAYGLIEKSGVAIPTVGPLGPAATVGMAAWLYGRMSKNKTAQHVATGLLAVAINRWAATGTIAGDGTATYYEDG